LKCIIYSKICINSSTYHSQKKDDEDDELLLDQFILDSKKHLAQHDESDNKYGFILQNPKQLKVPIPCNGQLNFFEFKPDLLKTDDIKIELFEEEHRYMWINHH